MMLYSAQEAFIGCMPAPDPGAGIIRRDSQIGYYAGIYYNQSSGPVTMESVSLLHPHNLIFHGAAVYKVAHFKILLPLRMGLGSRGNSSLRSPMGGNPAAHPRSYHPPGKRTHRIC
jgi:hypothetical protein